MVIEPNVDDASTRQRKLPSLSVDSMTQVQLLEFIPKLLTLANGDSSNEANKPKWWPEDVPWEANLNQFSGNNETGEELLRELIKGCYRYMGQENLLNCPDLPSEMKSHPSSPQTADSMVKAMEPSSEVKEETPSSLQDENTCPMKEEAPSPMEDEIPCPVKEKTPSQTEDEISCPVKEKTPSQTEDEITRQVNDKTPFEMEDEISCPVKEEISSPMQDEISCPVKEEIPSPMQDENPCPENEAIPSPMQDENPCPVKDQISSPMQDENPCPMKEETPSTMKAENPFPMKDENPCLVKEEKLFQIKEEKGENISQVQEEKHEKQEDDVVWICFVCAKEFPNQKELMTHQDSCEDTVDETPVPMETTTTPPDENVIVINTSEPIQAGNEIKLPTLTAHINSPLFHPGGQQLVSLIDKKHLPELHRPRPVRRTPVLAAQLQTPTVRPVSVSPDLCGNPVPAVLRKVGSRYNTLPLGLPLIRQRKRKKWPDIYIPPAPDVYFNSLGLGLTPKVKEIEGTPRKSEGGCEIIDLTLEEEHPLTPRTPKSLMSQWSRDEASGRRRHLSFTQTVPPPIKEQADESSSDSDTSESSQDERLPKRHVPCKSTLYAIPLTSPLGQRLKKKWQNENEVPVVADIEQYCSTRYSQFAKAVLSGGDVMDKLRHRPPPQVTFRFTKKYLNMYFHSYKFNSADKREFVKKLKYGLEKYSRQLLKLIKPCKVVLSRVSERDIKYWTTRSQRHRNADHMNRYRLQEHLKQKILLEQQKQMRAKLVQNNRFKPNSFQWGVQSFAIPQQSSHPMPMTLVPVKQLQGPTPQLLVKHGMGVVGMPLQVVPTSNHSMNVQQPVQPSTSIKREPPTGSQRRKQDFSNVRHDDEISIISLSSDEEDNNESNTKGKRCNCVGCQSKDKKCAIQTRPKIGPASFKRIQAMRQQNCIYAGSTSQVSREKLVNAQRNTMTALHDSAIGKPTQGASTISAAKPAEFMNFRMVNGQVHNLKTVNGQIMQQNTRPASPIILNKPIINRPFIHTKNTELPNCGSPNMPGSPASVPGSPIITPGSPVKVSSGSHVEKNDIYGYEVIMIDSEEED